MGKIYTADGWIIKEVTAAATDGIVGNQVTVQAESTKMNNPSKGNP